MCVLLQRCKVGFVACICSYTAHTHAQTTYGGFILESALKTNVKPCHTRKFTPMYAEMNEQLQHDDDDDDLTQ